MSADLGAARDDRPLDDHPLVDPALLAHVEEMRQVNEMVAAFMPHVPPPDTAEGLAQLRSTPGAFAGEPCPWAVDCTIPGPGGDLVLRVLIPPDLTSPRGVYLDLHGGGWCIGSAAAGDAANARIAEAAGVVVVSVEYRLAPEHPWPAGADDCEAAARWLVAEGAAQWGTDRLVIGGHSAGAHLAAVTLLRLRDAEGTVAPFTGANLVYGAYDLSMTPSQAAGTEALVIPRSFMEAFYAHTFPGMGLAQRRDPAVSPLYADLAGMPPALFTVGTADPLLDDSLFMAARWRAAGGAAELAVFPESPHGFPSFDTELSRRANRRIERFVADLVAG